MTCAPVAAKIWPPKDPDSDLDYIVEFERECARIWEADEDYALNVRVRPPRATGFEYEATTAGRSAARQPFWPQVIGQTVTDGSIVWTCRAMSSASLRKTISGTPTWAADSGITASGVSVAGTRASAKLGGGVDGQDYTVLVNALFSDGTDLTATGILPVRRPVKVCSAF